MWNFLGNIFGTGAVESQEEYLAHLGMISRIVLQSADPGRSGVYFGDFIRAANKYIELAPEADKAERKEAAVEMCGVIYARVSSLPDAEGTSGRGFRKFIIAEVGANNHILGRN